ncbi:sigma-70 family RNA polymerase sigma factor [Kaustia mangrovi]|nr:sigma-70 family RNA polymerase sigma factor [Kaustia mangrovi]
MTETSPHEFERHRGYLQGLAYRMLSSVAEAEDVVQDAYLRWHGSDREAVENPRAFLSRIVTRLCLDRLKSARSRRETYVGPWLPEPLIETGPAVDPHGDTVAEDVSVALMLALERLSPLERAAFILHDIFDMGFDEIAAALNRSAATCRQLASRARSHIETERPRFNVDEDEGARLSQAFFAASHSGDMATLRDILAETATLHGDGGGRKRSTLRPVTGADKIARFYAGLARKADRTGPLWAAPCTINGLPGWATVEHDGTLQTTALEIAGGRIAAVYVTRNPDKLRHVARMVPEGLLQP